MLKEKEESLKNINMQMMMMMMMEVIKNFI